MPERRYRTYQAFGRPQRYIERISHYVANQNLGDEIPRLCFERGVRRKRSGEFYLFIAVESSEASSEVLQHLDSIINGHHVADLHFEEIEKWASSEIEVNNYARRIPYRRLVQQKFVDPFDMYMTREVEAEPSQEIREALNRLLYWLSAVGSGTWGSFQKTFGILGLDKSGFDARQVARRLRLLGHLQYYENGTKWTVCPPCLSRVNTSDRDEFRYFLAGQRTPELLEVLSGFAKLEFIPQETRGAPDCVRFVLSNVEEVLHLLEDQDILCTCDLDLAGDVSKRLSSTLPTLDGYMSSLDPVNIEIGLYDVYRWQNGGFQKVTFDRRPGMYRLVPIAEDASFVFTAYYDPGMDQWLWGDWYGLRYLAMHLTGELCQVHLDTGLDRLAIPASCRWPDFYERALVLASGLLPMKQDPWLYFEDISRSLAKTLADKLSSSLERQCKNA